MSSDDFQAAVRLIEAHPQYARFAGPQAPDTVARAEGSLGVRFPPIYRSFVQAFGQGLFGGTEWHGVASSDPRDDVSTSVVSVTQGLRREDPSLSSEYAVISETGYGEYFVLRCVASRGHRDEVTIEGVVRLWHPTVDTDASPVVADDFGSFFLRSITDALSAFDA